MNYFEEILNILLKTIRGNTTEQIRNAQKQLEKHSYDSNFINNLTCILISDVQNAIKMAAANYTAVMARRALKSKSQENINVLVERLLAIMSNQKISIKYKLIISNAVEIMVACDNSRIIRSALAPNLLQLLKKSQQQIDSQIQYQYLVLLGQCLMSNPGYSEEIFKFIINSFSYYIKLINKLHIHLNNAILNKNQVLILRIILYQYCHLIMLYEKRFIFLDIESNKLLYIPQYALMIDYGLHFQLEQSPCKFMMINNQNQGIKLFNKIKALYIEILCSTLRILASYVKDINLLRSNQIYKKMRIYIEEMMQQSSGILSATQYYNITNQSQIEVLTNIFQLMQNALKINDFYQLFSNITHKRTLIQTIIFGSLQLSPTDYQNYYNQPQQYINNFLHIIERDTISKNEDIQIFDSFRTKTAQLLYVLCKFQDGTLLQIIQFALQNIRIGVDKLKNNKTSMFIVLCILKDQTKPRTDLHLQILKMISEMLTNLPLPIKSNEEIESISQTKKQCDILYSLNLLTLQRYYYYFSQLDCQVGQLAFTIIKQILPNNNIQQVPHIIILDLIDTLNRCKQGDKYCIQILQYLNNILQKQSNIHHKILDAYYSLFKYNDQTFKNNTELLIKTLNLLSIRVKLEIKKNHYNQLIINKCWNVIRDIGQNPVFVPSNIPIIQNAIMPLVPYVDGEKNYDFEEDILLLISSFIDKAKSVTQNQLKMFEIIPKIFYGQYHAVFGHSFQTLQTFIHYGKSILCNSPAAIRMIIEMAITSMSNEKYKQKHLTQSDNCEGVLVLQSLILSCGQSFDLEIWNSLIAVLNRRLENPIEFDFLKSNIIGCYALILIYGYRLFGDLQKQHLLNLIFNNLRVFSSVNYSSKVIIISLTELLQYNQQKFIQRKFVFIFDIIITILQTLRSNNRNVFTDEIQRDQQRDYQNSITTMINNITILDEFQYFKKQIKILQNSHLELLQNCVQQLPEPKKLFLKEILTVERVFNEPRQIFKIRRNI